MFAFTVVAARRQLSFRFVVKSLIADPVVLICAAGIFIILTLTAVTAGLSPPNSADAMAYHMPRIVYWAEQSSVRFFPTPYLNQIMLQPLAEYAMLHSYVISGGDHLVSFVPWFASLASIIGVSAVAAMFGAEKAGQAMAALFCATIPAGILASTGAKNDYWMALWMVAAVYFALSFSKTERFGDALFLGAAIGLALLTKATAYLFLPWFLAAIFLLRARRSSRLVLGVVIAGVVEFALNVPQYVRNYDLSGSIMGFDSAHGDGVFRWRNERPGWRAAASNVLRNLSEQLGARSVAWNQGVYNLVVEAHRHLGIDVNDPGTTWPGATFTPPKNANHEADAPNPWHLALIFLISCVLVMRALRRRELERPLYALALLCAFVAFCTYLKWQPFLGRLFLPLFVLSAPLTTVMRRALVQVTVCLFLLSNSRLPLIENWVRPLKGPRSVLHVPRNGQYFSDMNQWKNEDSYLKTVDLLANSKCETVGIDITNYTLEYPLQALLRQRKPGVRFVHTGVENASTRYRQPVKASPCAVACLDCAGDPKRLRLYRDFPASVAIDKFVIFH